ncbi:MAG: EamA family transporter [Acidobacteriota bacterium]
MKTSIVVALAVIAQAIGNTCLSKGMKEISSAGGDFSVMMLVQAMQTPIIWVGIVLLVSFFALFAAALSWADLSLVLPATAIGYVFNVFLAHEFLGEAVSPVRWAGTAVIFVGVVLVSRSGKAPGASGEEGR